MAKLSFNSDLHVHTNLSPCAPRESVPEDFLKLCAQAGVDTIGFSNHYWDADVPGVNHWYRELNIDHILKIREQIKDTYGVRVLIGCEAEYPGKLALTKENAVKLDYANITTSHFHHDVTIEGMRLENSRDVAMLMVERFLLGVADASHLPVPVSMSHPFIPLGFDSNEQMAESHAEITDAMFTECFSLAARYGVSIELHLRTLTGGDTYKDENGLTTYGVRMINIAKACGCTFTFGSDIHAPWGFVESTVRLREVARLLGITPDMMMEI